MSRISHESPVRGGGSEGLSLKEQEVNARKWACLWRTIILSALGKTIFPYCRHMRMLDLRDLGYLLEDVLRLKIHSRRFFANHLARFYFVLGKPTGSRPLRLDAIRVIRAVGDEIIKQAPLLEALSEPTRSDVLSGALLEWSPSLRHLQRLELFDGKAFADQTVRNLLHTHCPNLEMLKIYMSTSPEPDHALALFINGLQENKLTYFEILGNCGIGEETCVALNSQCKSLKTIRLALNEGGLLALGKLYACTAIESLSIACEISVNLKSTHHDVFLEITEWLQSCTALKEISFKNVFSAPDLLLPLLKDNQVKLSDLDINATKEDAMYILRHHDEFHRALSQQTTLRSLHLMANPETSAPEYLSDFLRDSLESLTGLRDLRLVRISDYFSDYSIERIARSMPHLTDLCIGGFNISDVALRKIASLQKLKTVSFVGLTRFTAEGIEEFIQELSHENAGLVLSVDNADAEAAISAQDLDRLKELIQTKFGGRFEYQLLRGEHHHFPQPGPLTYPH